MSHQFLLLLLLGSVAGCSHEVGKTELPDVYRFINGNLKQEVTINQNGNYLNTFYRDGVLVWSDQSSWEYEGHAEEFGVTFTNFRFGITGHSEAQGYWFVVPEKTLTGIKRFCFDPDLDQCFEANTWSR